MEEMITWTESIFVKLVRYWDEHLGRAVTRFLDIPVCNTATAENLFHTISTTMEKEQLSWENVVHFASDTANVMVRARNSVLSRLLEKQPNIFSLGCLCHLANLCSAAALKKLPFN